VKVAGFVVVLSGLSFIFPGILLGLPKTGEIPVRCVELAPGKYEKQGGWVQKVNGGGKAEKRPFPRRSETGLLNFALKFASCHEA